MSKVGYIYCYTDKSIMSPEDYRIKRRTSGIGIVISDKHNILRVASLKSHNSMMPYSFMTEDLLIDIPGVQVYQKESDAIKDLSGEKSTYSPFMSDKSYNAIKFVKSINDLYKNESGWYIPSLGELNRLHESMEVVMTSLESSKLTNSDLYKLITSDKYIVSITQKNPLEVYCMNLNNGIIKSVEKTEKVYGLSFKIINNNGED